MARLENLTSVAKLLRFVVPLPAPPHRAAKARYRMRKWAAYNQSLVQRGSITLWISDDMLAAWRPTPPEPRPHRRQDKVLS